MANLTIKNLPEDVHQKLKQQAAEHQRSLNSEVIFRLRQSIQPNRRSAKEIIAVARKLRSTITGSLTIEEIDAAINEGRP
jgi:plasmid stability protein